MAAAGGAAVARCFYRTFRSHSTTRTKATPWPDIRLWLQQLPDGTAMIAKNKTMDAAMAFDAYSQHIPGTREIRLGNERFFAFTSPRLGAEHLVVWRRVQDIKADAVAFLNSGMYLSSTDGHATYEPDSAFPLRVIAFKDRPQLTAAVWCWDDLQKRDPNRYWDDGVGGGAWMYWESFWVPTEPATYAAAKPAFGDVAGRMLAPLLGNNGVGMESHPSTKSHDTLRTGVHEEGPRDEHVVPSTAIATAMKDRAYEIVYQCNVWGSDVSRSGTGSDLWSPEARLATTSIEAVVEQFGIRSILDCACGDVTWIMPFFVARHPDVMYCGVDIVRDVIEQNRRKYKGVQFVASDIAEEPLPKGADLIFSKETLNHMSINDALQALKRFEATGARFLLTNVHEGAKNTDGFHKSCYTTYVKYDYSLPPFNMHKLATIIEYQGVSTSYQVFALQPF